MGIVVGPIIIAIVVLFGYAIRLFVKAIFGPIVARRFLQSLVAVIVFSEIFPFGLAYLTAHSVMFSPRIRPSSIYFSPGEPFNEVGRSLADAPWVKFLEGWDNTPPNLPHDDRFSAEKMAQIQKLPFKPYAITPKVGECPTNFFNYENYCTELRNQNNIKSICQYKRSDIRYRLLFYRILKIDQYLICKNKIYNKYINYSISGGIYFEYGENISRKLVPFLFGRQPPYVYFFSTKGSTLPVDSEIYILGVR